MERKGLIGDSPPRERSAPPSEQFGDLTGEIRLIVEATPNSLPWKPQEFIVRIEPREVAELGKAKVYQIRQSMQSKEIHQVTEQELELFMRRMLPTFRKVGMETVTRIANEIVNDNSSAETLLEIPEQRTDCLTELVERVTNRITPPDSKERGGLRRLVLAGALLLAAGASIFIPLIAPVAAQVILANEIAVATLTVTVAALIGVPKTPSKRK